jgi:His/Glu/Gln/Arg/opine family amino acid ABC transporter permease subunit
MTETAETVDPLATEQKRPERTLSDWLEDQTRVSLTAGVLGAAALCLVVIGTPILITTFGWVPSSSLAEAITSTAQGVLLWISLALGLVGAGLGWGTYRRMPNKAARETAVGGAVLGAQAVVLDVVFLWVRTGEVDLLVRQYFEFDLLFDQGPRFVRAALNTLVLSLAGETIGILLGLILAVFVLSRRPLVRAPARLYINFFRGTPLIWQLSFGWLGIVLALGLGVGAYLAAMVILGLNAGAYSAEIFRAGIESIDRGQFEAARSLGMSYGRALRHVILPQGVRRVIPPLTNEFVILIKDTSLVFILGLTFSQKELLSTARDLYAATFNATPWLAAAAGYLVITLPMIRVVRMLEERLNSGLTGLVGAQ